MTPNNEDQKAERAYGVEANTAENKSLIDDIIVQLDVISSNNGHTIREKLNKIIDKLGLYHLPEQCQSDSDSNYIEEPKIGLRYMEAQNKNILNQQYHIMEILNHIAGQL